MFRFNCDRPGHVAVSYKMWSTEQAWQPLSSDDSVEIFKLDDNGKQIIPQGEPEIVESERERKNNFQEIKSNLVKNKTFISARESEWWETFMTQEGPSVPDPWYLKDIVKFKKVADNTANELTVSPLTEVMEPERTIPKVNYYFTI